MLLPQELAERRLREESRAVVLGRSSDPKCGALSPPKHCPCAGCGFGEAAVLQDRCPEPWHQQQQGGSPLESGACLLAALYHAEGKGLVLLPDLSTEV